MLKISKIARHAVVQMGACARTPNSSSCPDALAKFY